MRDFVEEDRITTIEANRAELMAWLKAGAPHMFFDMEYGVIDTSERVELKYRETCGTACCIAGAAALMARGQMGLPVSETDFENKDFDVISEVALEFLGLENSCPDFGHELFNPRKRNGAKPEDAAIALQRTFDGKEPWAFDQFDYNNAD